MQNLRIGTMQKMRECGRQGLRAASGRIEFYPKRKSKAVV